MGLSDSDDLGMSKETPDGGVEIRTRTNELGKRTAVMVPRSLRALDADTHDLAVELQRHVIAIEQARQAVDEIVPLLREAGVSWDAIGWLTGMVGRSAQNRWDGK